MHEKQRRNFEKLFQNDIGFALKISGERIKVRNLVKTTLTKTNNNGNSQNIQQHMTYVLFNVNLLVDDNATGSFIG